MGDWWFQRRRVWRVRWHTRASNMSATTIKCRQSSLLLASIRYRLIDPFSPRESLLALVIGDVYLYPMQKESTRIHKKPRQDEAHFTVPQPKIIPRFRPKERTEPSEKVGCVTSWLLALFKIFSQWDIFISYVSKTNCMILLFHTHFYSYLITHSLLHPLIPQLLPDCYAHTN